jgi:hypothetical protein
VSFIVSNQSTSLGRVKFSDLPRIRSEMADATLRASRVGLLITPPVRIFALSTTSTLCRPSRRTPSERASSVLPKPGWLPSSRPSGLPRSTNWCANRHITNIPSALARSDAL